MGKQEKHAYLEAIRVRYHKSDRAGKAGILAEFCAVCGFHLKYAPAVDPTIRLTPRRKPGRKPIPEIKERGKAK